MTFLAADSFNKKINLLLKDLSYCAALYIVYNIYIFTKEN